MFNLPEQFGFHDQLNPLTSLKQFNRAENLTLESVINRFARQDFSRPPYDYGTARQNLLSKWKYVSVAPHLKFSRPLVVK